MASTVCTSTATVSLLDELLATFDGVFAEPYRLPPSCSRNQSITLHPGP